MSSFLYLGKKKICIETDFGKSFSQVSEYVRNFDWGKGKKIWMETWPQPINENLNYDYNFPNLYEAGLGGSKQLVLQNSTSFSIINSNLFVTQLFQGQILLWTSSNFGENELIQSNLPENVPLNPQKFSSSQKKKNKQKEKEAESNLF